MAEEFDTFENDPRYDAMASVKFAVSGQPVEFEDMINVALASKVVNAIDQKREEVAASIFGRPEEVAEPENVEVEEPLNTEEAPEEVTTEEE